MQGEGFVFFQEVLRELESEHGNLFCQLTEALLTSSIEQGTITYKTVVAVVEQHLLLRRQLTVVTMHIFDALKEFLIETDIIGMFRQNRTHLLRQGIHLVVGLCREQVEEYGADTIQQIVVVFAILPVVDGNNGIIKGGFGRIVDNLVYLLIFTTDALEHGLLVVFHTDTIKGRRVVGRVIRQEKRICSFFILVHD